MAITQLEFDILIKEEKIFEDIIKPLELGPAPIRWSRQINAVRHKLNSLKRN